MVDIDDDDADRILMTTYGDKDPIGVKRRYEEVDQLSNEHVLSYAHDMLAGDIPVPADAPRIAIDPVSRALLAHIGADPDAAEVLLRAANGIGLNDEDGEHVAMLYTRGRSDDDTASLRSAKIHLGSVTWEMLDDMKVHVDPKTLAVDKMANVHVDDLPETIRLAAVGRMLAEIVSHPVLDQRPIRIVGIDRSAFQVIGWITEAEVDRMIKD